jgi:uncharacterized integral membrane protein (TIGR00698 family)
VAVTLGNPWPDRTRSAARSTLAWSVVGLGAGMNLAEVARVGLHGLGYTAAGIALALAGGTYLGRRLEVSRDTSLLVTVGTAICGGSAIAAVAPALRARAHDVSIALAAVFLLNAVALYAFPAVGHALHLAPSAFGLWCALAIHDTSSVIGAASQYGKEALQVATAAKLARALWIVPVTLAVAALRPRAGGAAESPGAKCRPPWFIGGFVAMAALATYVPWLHAAGAVVSTIAHRLLTATLYLIGLGLSRGALRAVGVRPLVQALVLWVALAAITLVAVANAWVG